MRCARVSQWTRPRAESRRIRSRLVKSADSCSPSLRRTSARWPWYRTTPSKKRRPSSGRPYASSPSPGEPPPLPLSFHMPMYRGPKSASASWSAAEIQRLWTLRVRGGRSSRVLYNRTVCLSLPARASASTTSPRRSARGVWAMSFARAIQSWIATVAIKALPEAFGHAADRLARFQREAKTLASLNHPNIGAIYGLEESGGISALVMELVEGEDLSQRIAHGAIPIDEALPIDG